LPSQNFENHARTVFPFHFILLPVLLLTFIGSIVNLMHSLDDHSRLYSAALIVVLTLCLIITAFCARIFALKAQDRAIRAEENLRHFSLTGKPLDARLTPLQIVALRFASDAEFVALAAKAANESVPPKEIKRAIKNWRADEYRV
jgi:L-asparagine transporter-like permease